MMNGIPILAFQLMVSCRAAVQKQGCQMVCFPTKYPGLAVENLGILYFHLVYFTSIGNILWPFGIFCGHLVYFVVIWYSFSHFSILYQVARKTWQPCSNAFLTKFFHFERRKSFLNIKFGLIRLS
jgi:hypothetical protein